jgi:hypothetical protein
MHLKERMERRGLIWFNIEIRGPLTESNLYGFLTFEDGTDRLSRNVGEELPLLAA